MSRPPRIPCFPYTGVQRYFLTICTRDRVERFRDPVLARRVVDEILRTAADHEMAVLAYCIMPDHLHLLAEGQSERAELTAFVKLAKQRTGFAFKQRYGALLWQPGYYEHVLRDEETTPAIVAYIVNNPVRKHLVENPADYPYWGSPAYSRAEVLRFIGETRDR